MSEFRRRLMMAGSGGGFIIPYITDGLVFYLDGIEKGSNAGAWTDLIGGKVYTNQGATQESDGWTTSANGYLVCQENLVYPTTTTTLEICYSFSGSPQSIACVFTTAPTNTDSWAFGFWNANLLVSSKSKQSFTGLDKSANRNTFSVTNAKVLHNYIPSTSKGGNDYWGNTSYSYIGRRSGGNVYAFNGKIHSIRIYNRVLLEHEVRSNQLIDNDRFLLNLPQIQRVEYLQNTNNQYIDTDIIPDSQTGISVVVNDTTTDDRYIVGQRNSSDTDTRWLIGALPNNFYCGYGNQLNMSPSLHPSKAKLSLNYLNDGMFIVQDAEDASITSSLQLPNLSFSPSRVIELFGGNGNAFKWSGKMYECTITQGGSIIRHFVPVRIGSVGYMYDDLNGVLYANNGTGSFTYGNDIN